MFISMCNPKRDTAEPINNLSPTTTGYQQSTTKCSALPENPNNGKYLQMMLYEDLMYSSTKMVHFWKVFSTFSTVLLDLLTSLYCGGFLRQ